MRVLCQARPGEGTLEGGGVAAEELALAGGHCAAATSTDLVL